MARYSGDQRDEYGEYFTYCLKRYRSSRRGRILAWLPTCDISTFTTVVAPYYLNLYADYLRAQNILIIYNSYYLKSKYSNIR